MVAEDREARQAIITEIAEKTDAQIAQTIGKIVLLYKKAAKQNPKLSNLVRFANAAN